jgi:hypothetical protein
MTTRVLESCSNPKTHPTWTQLDTRPLGQIRVTQHRGWKGFGSKLRIAVDSEQIWRWLWIHWKLDLISFPGSIWTTKTESGWSHGGHYKSCLFCSPNPACAMPLPFWSNPLFLSKTRVHVSPLSKYDEPELKSELTWWVSWRARARVIGPRGVVEVDTGVGVDVSLVAMFSSHPIHFIGPIIQILGRFGPFHYCKKVDAKLVELVPLTQSSLNKVASEFFATNAPDPLHWTQNSCFSVFWTILLLHESQCKTSRTSAINAKVR